MDVLLLPCVCYLSCSLLLHHSPTSRLSTTSHIIPPVLFPYSCTNVQSSSPDNSHPPCLYIHIYSHIRGVSIKLINLPQLQELFRNCCNPKIAIAMSRTEIQYGRKSIRYVKFNNSRKRNCHPFRYIVMIMSNYSND